MSRLFLHSLIAVLLLSLLAGCASRQRLLTEIEPTKRPNDWFYRQRASQGQGIPVDARGRALRTAVESDDLGATPGSWQQIGPFNVGGRVTGLAVDPNDPDHLWLGTAAGGVWESTDEGVNWSPVFDDQVALSIGDLATHPTDSNIVYVGTGEDNGGGFSYDGAGVYKTIDGGQSWSSLGLAEVRRIGKLAVDPTDGDTVFVAAGGDWYNPDAHRGIYRTTDGGQNWTQVLFVDTDAGGIDIVIDPNDPDRIYASIWQRMSFGSTWIIGGSSSGIYRSIDGGDTWSEMTSGLPASSGRIGLAIAPANSSMIYANIIDSSGDSDGIYLSTNGGDNWSLRNSPSFSGFSYYFSQIRVDPIDPKTVYALDQRLHKSTNSAASFSLVAPSVHVDWHALIPEAGGRILAGTDGGFFISQNNGLTWTHAETLPITQFYDFGLDTLDPTRRFAGAQDNGTVNTNTAGLSDWANVLGGDGLQCEVDYTNSNKVYASAQFGNLFRSVNGGSSFLSAQAGIAGSERNNWNQPYIIDPVVPTTLYTATERVYRSLDSAVSWTPASPNLTNLASGGSDHHDDDPRSDHLELNHLENLVHSTVTVVHVSPVDTDIIWAGTDDGNVWVTSNAGGSWSQVNPTGPAYWVTDIAADRFDASAAYLTVTGYRQGDKLPYVRKTVDLGATWTDVSGNLPQLPVNSILTDPDWHGRLFVGNDVGVFVSDDDGLSWSVLRDGMPWVVVMDMVRHDPTDVIYAATHARSNFTFDLAQLGIADGDGDGVDNNLDCALADPGAFAEPGEVVLSAARGPAGETELAWNDLSGTAGSGTIYDVARGAISALTVGGVSGAASLVCELAATAYSDAGGAAAGDGYFYLLRSRNSCGLGGWGFDGNAIERIATACP